MSVEAQELQNLNQDQTLTTTDKAASIPPEGWSTRRALSRLLQVDFYTVDKLALPLREEHPEWFQVFRPTRRRAAEHFSPEVASLVTDSLGQDPPDGWKIKGDLKKEQNLEWVTAKRLVEEYREEHPEWFGTYRSRGSRLITEHYAPELIDSIQQSLPDHTPEDWPTRGALSKSLGASSSTVEIIANRFREEHPEWFGVFRSNSGIHEHFSPQLAAEIEKALAEKGPEKNITGSIRWSMLKEQNPDQLPDFIEQQITEYLADGHNLKSRELQSVRPSLYQAITVYYPGGFGALRIKFDAVDGKKPRGYWTPDRIEEEALKFYQEHGSLSARVLQEHGRVDLSRAILSHYPGKIKALQAKFGARIVWSTDTIVEQVRTFIETQGGLSQALLVKQRRFDLLGAIQRAYKGGLVQLKQDLGIEEQRKPKGFWTKDQIELEARNFLDQEGVLTAKALSTAGRSDLLSAIVENYPGAISKLKANLGIPPTRRPMNYWTAESILNEAREFIESNGAISQALMSAQDRHDLSGAISSKYPGGLTKLQLDLGLRPSRLRTGWTPDLVRTEAEKFQQAEGALDHNTLRTKGRADISVAITRTYPGGMTQLLIDLGLKITRRNNYWTSEVIEQQAQTVYQRFGSLSHSILNNNEMAALSVVITSKYPGGIRSLKEKLGIEVTTRPSGYWKIPENIEAEAKSFYEREGSLGSGLLEQNGLGSLTQAIRTNYPGGMQALKEKLGLVDPSLPTISSEQANSELSKLLGGEL